MINKERDSGHMALRLDQTAPNSTLGRTVEQSNSYKKLLDISLRRPSFLQENKIYILFHFYHLHLGILQ